LRSQTNKTAATGTHLVLVVATPAHPEDLVAGGRQERGAHRPDEDERDSAGEAASALALGPRHGRKVPEGRRKCERLASHGPAQESPFRTRGRCWPSELRAPNVSICASARRPTTCAARWRAGASGPTCTFGSAGPRSPSRLCASGSRSSLGWSPPNSRAPARSSRRARPSSKRACSAPGPATFGSYLPRCAASHMGVLAAGLQLARREGVPRVGIGVAARVASDGDRAGTRRRSTPLPGPSA
jgi:hypothetical protein